MRGLALDDVSGAGGSLSMVCSSTSPAPSSARGAASITRPIDLGAVLVHCIVALMLLLAQREAALHWLSHATLATGKQAFVVSAEPCDECLSIAGVDTALGAGPVAVPVEQAAPVEGRASTWTSAASLLQLGYASRGPPLAA